MRSKINNFQTLFSFFKHRYFSNSSVSKSSYDCDGKTVVTVLNQNSDLVMIDSYTQFGFRLNNGVFVVGPMVLFPHTAFSWNIRGDQEISQESLTLFSIIEPKLELVVIGYGSENPIYKKNMNRELLAFRTRTSINIELMPSIHAISTFNYLNSESRWVAGAFIPPLNLASWIDDVAESRKKRKMLYESKD